MGKDVIYLDPDIIDRHLLRRGWTLTELSNLLPKTASEGTRYKNLQRIRQRHGVLPSFAFAIAKELHTDVLNLLAPWERLYKAPIADGHVPEWEHAGYLRRGHHVPNGLFFIECRMRHRFTADLLGRGKFYHLSLIRPDQRQELTHKLARHADVCHAVGLHPNIAVNLSSRPTHSEDGWWVIDDWVGEKNLEELLKSQSWPQDKLASLLLQIASGLAALHNARVVMRELAPSRVLLTGDLTRAVITDFELAKLLRDVPTVSATWKDGDKFRAPEIIGTDATPAADLFSLAQLAACVLSRGFEKPNSAAMIITVASLPPKIEKFLLQCLERTPEKRPQEIGPLINELNRWVEKTCA